MNSVMDSKSKHSFGYEYTFRFYAVHILVLHFCALVYQKNSWKVIIEFTRDMDHLEPGHAYLSMKRISQ